MSKKIDTLLISCGLQALCDALDDLANEIYEFYITLAKIELVEFFKQTLKI
jgi:hypothetical protein